MNLDGESVLLGLIVGVLIGLPLGYALKSVQSGGGDVVYQRTDDGFLLSRI